MAKVEARLIGGEDPDEWDLPPKPEGMRWATYEWWVAHYDAAEDTIDAQLKTQQRSRSTSSGASWQGNPVDQPTTLWRVAISAAAGFYANALFICCSTVLISRR
jgi:hypothetical protein